MSKMVTLTGKPTTPNEVWFAENAPIYKLGITAYHGQDGDIYCGGEFIPCPGQPAMFSSFMGCDSRDLDVCLGKTRERLEGCHD